jgi:hypothetical protein
MKRPDSWNDILRQISIAPSPKRRNRRKPRGHRYESLEVRELLTTVNAQSSGNSLYISLSPPVNETVVVGYTLTGDVGTGPEHATQSITASFAPNATSVSVYALPSDDADGDPNQTASATLDITSVTWQGFTAVSIGSAQASASLTETTVAAAAWRSR